jgi:predicted alpha/beta-hydrolase family hydrolase
VCELPALRFDGDPGSSTIIVLAHGAGAPMDSAYMQWFAEGFSGQGLRVARFEFPYMAKRRSDGRNSLPDRLPVLVATWLSVINALNGPRLVIGGKSMGGRVASIVAADMDADVGPVRGVVCLGYPFHAPGREARPNRLEHLASMAIPTLILQGNRDPFGGREDVSEYELSAAVRIHWIEDGDHDMKPRRASGRDWNQNRKEAMDALLGFVADL